MFKNALISVSDKAGLTDFVKPLVAQGMRIVSSGGTAKFLEDAGISVVRVSEQTGFPEVMGGRVKTLHPYIHMPLLYREDGQDQDVLKEHNLQPFDLVVVNLYPFANGLQQKKEFSQMVELIDIGGPTLLRAAAKNFSSLAVVVDPSDYSSILEKQSCDREDRRQLAAKVFDHVSQYDRKIADYLAGGESWSVTGKPVSTLRYGENPQQTGAWFQSSETGLHSAKILQGKPLSYNNLVDLDGACRTVNMFEGPTVVSVKHNNPCGIAGDVEIHQALEKSLKADPVSVFGGIIASNRPIDKPCAESLSKLFLECIVAPEYTPEALEVLEKKKNLRLLQWAPLSRNQQISQDSFRSVWGGFLVQSSDVVNEPPESWKVFGKTPDAQEARELLFAWKACASLKSNAIAISSGQQTLGLGMGQVNRVDAVRQAIRRAQEFHSDKKDWVLGSDAFFPFPDSIEVAAAAGVRWVIQPGGSIRDEEVIAMAKKLDVNMVFTGQRHFLH